MIKNLVLVGCGHMGQAMLRPWLDEKIAEKIWVIEPNKESLRGFDKKHVAICESRTGLPPVLVPDVIVIAVKPQVLENVLQEYKRYGLSLFLTIAAGKPLAVYEKILSERARVVRAMPNLAAKVQEAATLLVAGKNATADDRKLADALFSKLGSTFWLEDESLMDLGTALSGCGPAYFYLLAELAAQNAAAFGLPQELAKNLARQTLIGAAAYARDEKASLQKLYESVAVKGGMTEAALAALNENGNLKKLMEKALKAAVERARKLSS